MQERLGVSVLVFLRRLPENKRMLQNEYPLPCIKESPDALAGSRYLSTLDLTSGDWQVLSDV